MINDKVVDISETILAIVLLVPMKSSANHITLGDIVSLAATPHFRGHYSERSTRTMLLCQLGQSRPAVALSVFIQPQMVQQVSNCKCLFERMTGNIS